MAEKIISALVEGGKASAGPPLGPALGPMGINIGKVIAEINQKTTPFAGTTVPVKVIINQVTKDFRIEVGTPSVSALIKKELSLESGSSKAKEELVGDLAIDQAIRIARAKGEKLHARTPQKAVKEILGACVSMGVTVEGKDPRDVQKEIDNGIYDSKILGKEKLREVSRDEIEKKKSEYKEKVEAKRKAEEAAKAAAEAAKVAAAAAAGAPAPGAPAAEGKAEEKAPAEAAKAAPAEAKKEGKKEEKKEAKK
jgi:large subunit ribosomal protein L11